MRFSRGTQLQSDDGFGLIEVVISAFLLVTVTFGTLSLIDYSGKNQARNRDRSTSAAVAERDQEQLRTFAATKLGGDVNTGRTGYGPFERDDFVAGVKYHVLSKVDWVRERTGAAASCENATGEAEYLRLTSTVSAPTADPAPAPVTMVSYYTPGLGDFGRGKGTLVARVLDRTTATGVRNVPVTITGPQNASAPAPGTNELGCAVFRQIPIGSGTNTTYTVTFGSAGLGFVDFSGNRTPTLTTTLTNGNTSKVQKVYDKAGSLAVTQAPVGSFLPAPPAALPAYIAAPSTYGVTVVNGTNNITRTFPATRPANPSTALQVAGDLFPFVDGYSTYAGTCVANDPAKWGVTTANYGGMATTTLLAGQLNKPLSAPMPVQRFQLKGTDGKLFADKTVKITATAKQSTISGTNYPCAAYDSFSFVGKTEKTNAYIGLALPFGTYDFCIDDQNTNANNRLKLTKTAVQNKAIAGVDNSALQFAANTKGSC